MSTEKPGISQVSMVDQIAQKMIDGTWRLSGVLGDELYHDLNVLRSTRDREWAHKVTSHMIKMLVKLETELNKD